MNNTAWHFTGNTLRDGSPIPAIGETLVFPGKVELCRSGYHWSLKPHQALKYAPGATLHKVRFGGYVERRADKGVSSERTIIASIDATNLLRRFAADQALGVSHLWDMPEVVHDYLTTLDESKRKAAWGASKAAWDAVWDAEEDVAGAATLAACNAARASAEAAARAAAEAAEAAWDAAWDAAWGAAMQEFDRRVYEAFD
jgi:hypothetical protein